MLKNGEAEASENVKTASRYCPNYIIISTELSEINTFVGEFQHQLSRRDSRYALVFPHGESFSADTFLQMYPYFKKVLNLALIVPQNKSDKINITRFLIIFLIISFVFYKYKNIRSF